MLNVCAYLSRPKGQRSADSGDQRNLFSKKWALVI